MDRSPTIPLSAFIAITVIVGGFFWIKGPLESKRPAPAERGDQQAFGLEDVDARLWQDPFLAIEAHHKPESGAKSASNRDRHTLESLRRRIANRSNRVRVMPVMVPGGAYAVEVEQRRRTRKAVVSALGVAGFHPDDDSRIGYVKKLWSTDPALDSIPRSPQDATSQEESAFEVIVPFEWFLPFKNETDADDRKSRIDRDILVLWIDESLMGSRVVAMLHQMLAELEPTRAGTGPVKIDDVHVIGPSSSTTVLGLMARGEKDPHANKPLAEPGYTMTFFNCRSTAPPQLLLAELDSASTKTSLAGRFQDLVGAGFVRTVATDSSLLAALDGELAGRGIHLGKPDVKVALVGEWDTFYGRAIPKSFAELLGEESKQDGQPTHSPRLYKFAYLRGLDGIVPGSEVPAKPSGGDRGGSAGSSTAFVARPDDAAWPFGRNQLDNIQRLTEHLERLDDELARENTSMRQPFKNGIDVIGVVGSDIYDKLLILQALTRRFPNAVFFTTDLDAQMLHPTQQAWARNVIVVSSYGLALDDRFQKITLPFRDNYQTATYAAVLHSCGEITHLESEPRVFEIGRHDLVDLTPPATNELYPPFRPAELRIEAMEPRIGFWIAVVATLVAIVLGFLFDWKVRQDADSKGRKRTREHLGPPLVLGGTVALIVAGFAALYVYSLNLWNQGDGEPVSAFGGVSAWPIQYWRWAVIVLSGAFFFHAHELLTAHRKRVERRFGLGDDDASAHDEKAIADLDNTRSHWRKYVGFSRAVLDPKFVAFLQEDRRRAGRSRTLVEGFERSLAGRVVRGRVGRIARGLLIFGAFMVGLYLIYGLPPAPFRGEAIKWLHWSLFLISGFCAAAVTIYVLDAILLCWRRILTLAPADSGWPARITQAFRTRLEIPDRVVEPLNQILDLELIAATTRVVGNLLRWPFLLLFMMILSRNTLHESWSLTPTLLYTYGALFTLALISAVGLRTQAARTRNHVLENLREWRCGIDPDAGAAVAGKKAMREHGSDVAVSPPPDCTWIDRVSDHVMAMDKGAFAPWYRHPIIQSVLLPLSGLVLITVTELIARSGQ